jgi:hypothetical protein
VARESIGQTLEREVSEPLVADLQGWRRRWSLLRDNHRCEKTFALPDGSLPDFILGLNIEVEGEDPAGPVNGVVVELAEGEIERLDLREVRYDRVEVTDRIRLRDGGEAPGRIWTYTAKRPGNFAASPPPGAVIVDRYAEIVGNGFAELGPGELERYEATTGPFPVEVVAARLIRDEIPQGNPRRW